MPFTLETWKAQVYERLWAWRLRLEQARPTSVYSTLSAMALWPLVQAAQSEGMLPMAMTLGNVAAGVGGNLIAEQVQRWRDHAAEASHDEATIAAWVKEHLATQADLRLALDNILERLEAVPQAQATLDEAQRVWFAQTLRQELAAIGSLARFAAHLTGSGSTAQGPGAAAAGARGVAGSNIQGSVIITGDNVMYTSQAQSDPGAALAAYRHVLVTSCRHLPLRGVVARASDPIRGQSTSILLASSM
jgi:uncharacterized protein YecT (DUF1311 family)